MRALAGVLLGRFAGVVDRLPQASAKIPPPPTATAIGRAITAVRLRLMNGRLGGMSAVVWVGLTLLVLGLIGALAFSLGGQNPAAALADGQPNTGTGGFVPQRGPDASRAAIRTRQREMTPAEQEEAGRVLDALLDPASPVSDTAFAASADAGDASDDELEAETPITESETKPAVPAEPDPPDAEAAARAAIEAIVERQRRGTETADLTLLLADVAPALHDDVRDGVADMESTARDVTSQISDIRIALRDATHATVSFHTVLTGIRKRDERRVTIYDGAVRWTLERSADRWLIVAIG